MLRNMIDNLRFALYAVLIVIVFALYQTWIAEHPTPVEVAEPKAEAQTNYIPTISNSTKTDASTLKSTVNTTVIGQSIHVTTDVIDATIDTLGGNIIGIKLLNYPESLHSKTPFVLLNNDPSTRYIAQSGLLSSEGPDTSKGQALYTVEKTDYSLLPDQQQVAVNLTWQNTAGLTITKTLTFQRNSYEVLVSYQIDNKSPQTFEGNLYLQLMRKNNPPPATQGFMSLATYFGAAVSTPAKPYEKISYKDMLEKPLNQTVTGGWAAMIQHYFVSAWIPNATVSSQYFSRVTGDGLYTIGSLGPQITVAPGETAHTDAKLFTGPAITEILEKAAPGLQLTVDYGWFWFISAPILWLMKKIYDLIGNWGWSIVLVTVIIKLAFYQLSAKSYRSMSGMKKIQPKINELKERYGDDKQKFTQETLALYKKEKVNPMSGCLPILIQIPVFIALYWVLIESVELRQAPWILWIKDLSTKDPFYVLPVLMGISMFLQQRLNPPPADPMQAKVMMLMPIFFTVLFVNFPAGLMLYWFVNNTLSFLQQWYIMKTLDKVKK